MTCIASNGGWLLVYRDGIVFFFFCPFSRARIDLPALPHSELSDHVAVISSVPTSLDCIVGVINHRNCNTLVLNLIRRGSTEWTIHEFLDTLECLRTITSAAYLEGVFYFLDCTTDASVTFSLEEIKWGTCKIIYHEPSNSSSPNTLPFSCNCTPPKTLPCSRKTSNCTTPKPPPLFARNSFRRTKIVEKLGFPEQV
ncbi:F-box protein At1g49360-like [Macadamia integrifolia]|uniref:F-box protein At1g49360-like n=1 Tax=Macadamia integrifolia TaxID=60698 RepID=UPI001C4E6695|nr:F-box protein At1g49360-like [Macadamia integrifolia]